jgi:hypothetical protein
VDLAEYDEIIRRLTAMLVVQQEKNQQFEALLEAQREFNRQQVEFNQHQREFNADVRTTLARIEALLQRVVRGSDNGREA